MWRVWLALVVLWVALMPPLFTGGACTREFEAASAAVEAAARTAGSPGALREQLARLGATARLLTPEECRQAKPRFLAHCASSTIVYGSVPVTHPVCRLYRDDETRFQIDFDGKGRVARVSTDMKPFKSLPLPMGEVRIHWGR
jgi:hypothetical protein